MGGELSTQFVRQWWAPGRVLVDLTSSVNTPKNGAHKLYTSQDENFAGLRTLPVVEGPLFAELTKWHMQEMLTVRRRMRLHGATATTTDLEA